MSLNQQGACAATELMLNVYKPSKCTLNTREQLLSDRNDRGKQKLWNTCSMDCWRQSGDLQILFNKCGSAFVRYSVTSKLRRNQNFNMLLTTLDSKQRLNSQNSLLKASQAKICKPHLSGS